MEYRRLGNSGLKVSVLSLGAWTTWGLAIDDETAFNCMKTAFDLGCNFFDNAEVYGDGKAEETMGKCIQRLGKPRSQLVISTKIFWGGKTINDKGLSRKHIIEGLDASLKRLQLDYVDLLFCHRPDPETPMEETVRAMNFVINQGKVLYWGTSEWSADQILEAHHVAQRLLLIGPIMEQPQYNLLHRTRFEKEYERLYKEINLGTTIWSPLACGVLSGKYNLEGFNSSAAEDTRLGREGPHSWLKKQLLSGEGLNNLEEKDIHSIFKKIDGLRPIAESLGCTLAQLSLAWCIKNPHVSTVITGASKAEQIVENFKSLEFVPKMTQDVMDKIESVIANKPVQVKNYRG